MSTLTCKKGAAGMRAIQPRMSSAVDSPNWSGYVDTSAAPNFVTASWRVPRVCCSFEGNNYSVIWPGIGDASVKNTSLIQDGTGQDITSRGRTSYYFWYEAVPQTALKQVTSLRPRPGDEVMTSASWQTQAVHTASYVLCDGRVRRCVNFGLRASRPDDKVEWIAERTEVCHSGHWWWPPMADFTNPELSVTAGRYDIDGSGSPEFPISRGHPQRWNMSGGGSRIETPQRLRSRGTAFTDIQNSPGTWLEVKKDGHPERC